MRYPFLIVCLICAAAVVLVAVLYRPVEARPGLAYVSKVHDGDTIEVDDHGHHEKIRLIGIDTPETVDPRRPIQCFGKEASTYSKKLMHGKYVRLEADHVRVGSSDRDKYGRLLRYVYLDDGTFVNENLVRQGYAHEYTFQSQPYDFQTTFKQAEKEAQAANRGLWSPGTCRGDTKQAA